MDNAAVAQSVRIQNAEDQFGYGWMFHHAGACYAALPAHVAGALPFVTISTSAPVVSDVATVVKPFWPGVDLAVAVIGEGPLRPRCVARLADLTPTPAALSAQMAQLRRISPVGEEWEVPIRVIERDYLSLTAETVREGDTIFQGVSGAFAFAAGRPIGMAIESGDPRRAFFMRAEEIALNVGRYIADQGRAFAPRPVADAIPAEGHPIRDIRANAAPILPQYGPDNLIGDGLWIVRPEGPVRLTFRVGGREAVPVRRVRLLAPTDGDTTIPKAVSIQLDVGERGDRFRFWVSGEMRPDGVFDTGPRAARNARWVRIEIANAWGDGDLALSRIVVE